MDISDAIPNGLKTTKFPPNLLCIICSNNENIIFSVAFTVMGMDKFVIKA